MIVATVVMGALIWFFGLSAVAAVTNTLPQPLSGLLGLAGMAYWSWFCFKELRQRLAKLRQAKPRQSQSDSPDTSARIDLARTDVAVHAPVRIVMRYKDAEGAVTTRSVDLRTLTFDAGTPRGAPLPVLAGGYCHLRKEPRTFRIDRIEELVLPDGEVIAKDCSARNNAVGSAIRDLVERVNAEE